MKRLGEGRPSLLIALPQLQDPNFSKTVVLVLENDDKGAMGFVINRKSPYLVADILNEDVQFRFENHDPAWFGGPVQTERAVIIHRHNKVTAETNYGEIRVSSSIEALSELMEAYDHKDEELYPYRFIIGYTGWDAGQLADEIKSGAWLQTDLDLDLLFNTDHESIWLKAMQSLGVRPDAVAPAMSDYMN